MHSSWLSSCFFSSVEDSSLQDGSALGSFGQGGDDFLEERATCNTNIKKCLRKVKDGHFTTSVKVLPSSGVAPYCDDTIKALEVKHPYKPPPSMPSITFFEPPLVVEIDSVFGCIKSFPKGTSCERDGLRAQHILDALCEEGSATTDLLKVITSVVNLWLAGRCLPILAKFVASAPLTPLFKPDNEIRPIAVGTIWRRLVSKLAMKGVGKEMSKYLSDFQSVVGLSGGTEVVLHSVNSVLSEYHNDESLAMLNVDFSNAFNLVDRSASLHEQSDSLRPFLFALVLNSLVHKIKDRFKLLLHVWYLDDVTVIRYSEEAVIRCEASWGSVSRDTYFISGLDMRRAGNVVDLMSLLPLLRDPLTKVVSSYAFLASRAQSWVLQDHISYDSGICGKDDDYVYALACLRDMILEIDITQKDEKQRQNRQN
ncbi:hypothetical protein Tco_0897271 [Tanacetum coccineum]